MPEIPSILRPLLIPPGLIYETLIRARNILYQNGGLRQKRLPRPVISVGNITLGGTGKTPLVIYLARLLSSRGYETALLTRGYGRSNAGRNHLVPPGYDPVPSVSKIGDEPALVRMHVPGIWLGVSHNRHLMGNRILQQTHDPVFLLDDAFQHRKLKRDLDLVVIDVMQKLAENRVFPSGTLREPLGELHRAHAIIINRGPREEECLELEQLIRRYQPDEAIFHCRQKIENLVPLEMWNNTDVSKQQGNMIKSVFLAAAIGNPTRFQKDVEARHISVKGFKFFRDHFAMKREHWITCAEEARSCGAEAILTTEKDAIKLNYNPNFPLFVATQSIELVEEEEFHRLVQKTVEQN